MVALYICIAAVGVIIGIHLDASVVMLGGFFGLLTALFVCYLITFIVTAIIKTRFRSR